MVIKEELPKSAVEILEILKNAPDSVNNSIPNQIKEYLKKIASKEHKFEYNYRKQPFEQNVSNLTRALLSELYINYMCQMDKKAVIDNFFRAQ